MLATIAIASGMTFGTIYFGIYSLVLIKKNADLRNKLNRKIEK